MENRKGSRDNYLVGFNFWIIHSLALINHVVRTIQWTAVDIKDLDKLCVQGMPQQLYLEVEQYNVITPTFP